MMLNGWSSRACRHRAARPGSPDRSSGRAAHRRAWWDGFVTGMVALTLIGWLADLARELLIRWLR